MSRIAEKFAEIKNEGRKGFIPFVTAGDPNFDTSHSIVLKLAEMGADIIELGVPFSDPMADGPTVQRSSQRALDAGTTLNEVLKLAVSVRRQTDVPIVLFSYFNPILRYGLIEFQAAASEAGIDGVLLTDVIENEAAAISERFSQYGIDLISLIAPTTTDERLKTICENGSGFIYAVSRAGVTGAREKSSSDAEKLVQRARKFTDLPIAVGFGISTAQQITDVWQYADAAVVGSAIVAEIERAGSEDDVVDQVGEFIRNLMPEVANSGVEN